MALEAGKSLAFWFALSGVVVAWLFTAMFPSLSQLFKQRFAFIYQILKAKYGFDDFNQKVLVEGTKEVGRYCYEVSDVKLLDDVMVNGSGRLINWFALTSKRLQTGYLYQYALVMVLGIVCFLTWYVVGL
jgi:NADH-quinone oxidoreductase subunit L